MTGTPGAARGRPGGGPSEEELGAVLAALRLVPGRGHRVAAGATGAVGAAGSVGAAGAAGSGAAGSGATGAADGLGAWRRRRAEALRRVPPR